MSTVLTDRDQALEQRIRAALERYYASRLPQDWQAFVALHKSRSKAQVARMERDLGLR